MGEQSIEFVKGVYGAFTRGDVPAELGATRLLGIARRWPELLTADCS
jgi:hypothetical protein